VSENLELERLARKKSGERMSAIEQLEKSLREKGKKKTEESSELQSQQVQQEKFKFNT
jgi:hypothetical protein